jgi:xylan 1,4-beta-xylosidase
MKRLACLLILTIIPALPQDAVTIRVDGTAKIGPFKPIASYFGYDEPNYTYTDNGRKLISELASLTYAPVYIRAHNLLTSGDGTPALKWGSTNAYTEDASGKPVYSWTIVDRIFDTYLHANAKPFVELGFMPEALSTKPEPYQHSWPKTRIAAGWGYPPKDYAKWGELIRQLVLHSIQRYGEREVNSWYFEVWNEPDIEYWQGTPEEYMKMYDSAVKGVKSAAPRAHVGGPATTGPANPKAAAFLRQFLEHCAQTGAPLDFVSYHAKGRPTVVEGRVRMGIQKNLQDVSKGMEILTSFPRFKNLPIILSESDPEGCAACSARGYPQNAYRNGALYPCYTAAMLKGIFELADRSKANIEGMLTWAFEFEGQPYFDGFRTLATNGVDKPVLNVFRMAGLMRGERVAVESSAAVKLDDILNGGVGRQPDIDALGTRSDRDISVLAWNYHDDDAPGPDPPVKLTIAGAPASVRRLLLRHYRIDRDHSNAYTVWTAMGSPQQPTPEQFARLEQAGQLELLESPKWLLNNNGKVDVAFSLPPSGRVAAPVELVKERHDRLRAGRGRPALSNAGARRS